MIKSVAMVISNKILSMGSQLAQTQWYEKEQNKRNSKITISLTLSKLKVKFIT